MIHDEEPLKMIHIHKHFRGEIKQIDEFRVITSGVVSLLVENSIEINELPIGVWTQAYKESVLEDFFYGSEKDKGKEKFTPLITVLFVVQMTTEQFSYRKKQGYHKYFKLQSAEQQQILEQQKKRIKTFKIKNIKTIMD
jgi:DNA topoisomerase-2